MKKSLVVWIILGGLCVAAWVSVLTPRVINLDAEVPDPAIEFYTRAHSGEYGGVDRWTYAGMPVDAFAARLQQKGFQCTPPQAAKVGGRPQEGVHRYVCSKAESSPARTLWVEADVDYSRYGRLLAVRARSEVGGGMGGLYAALLRRLNRLEPETLTVTGMSFDDVEMFAKAVADTLDPFGFVGSCSSVGSNAAYCSPRYNDRQQRGFPDVPKEVPVGNLSYLIPGLMNVGLSLPKAGDLQRDRFPVRLAKDQIWIDLTGKDLAGHPLAASIRVDSDGAVPRELVLQVNKQKKSLTLAAQPNLSGSSEAMVLLPLRVENGVQWAKLLVMPRRAEDLHRLRYWKDDFPNIEPVYLTQVLQSLMKLAQQDRRDESLSLSVPLQAIERSARLFKQSELTKVFVGGDGNKVIREVFAEQPEQRIGWTLASCVREDDGLGEIANEDCWQAFLVTDPVAANLLKNEVLQQQPIYAKLAADHPVRQRMDLLARVSGVPALTLSPPSRR